MITDPAEVRAVAAGDLIAQLGDPKKGRQAAQKLVKFGQAAVPGLVKALSSRTLQVRFYAANVLDAIGGREATMALLRVLSDANENPLVRGVAARAAGRAADGRATSVLLMLAQKSLAERPAPGPEADAPTPATTGADERAKAELRFEVIRALAYISAPESFAILVKALADGDPRIREAAAQGLGDHRVPEALDGLIGLLADPDERVVRAAALAVGKYGRSAESAAGELVAALARGGEGTKRTVRGALVMTTGRSFKTDAYWREWWDARRLEGNKPTKADDAGPAAPVDTPAPGAETPGPADAGEKAPPSRPTSDGKPPALRSWWDE